MSKREGSPFTGVQTVAIKEAADHISSARLHLIMLLVMLVSAGALYAAVGQIKQTTAQSPYLFLQLLTVAQNPLPSFASLLGFLLPLMAIGLGFDAVNGEFNRRTLSRILAQPIYRDALLFGKLLGGLLVMTIALLTLWLITTGVGILMLGQPPSGDDVARGLAYLFATLVYSGVWLAVAIAFSTFLRSPATSALAALALWLVLSVFWSMLAPLAAGAIAPVNPLDPTTALRQYEVLPGCCASRPPISMARSPRCCSIRPRAASGRCSCRICRARCSTRRSRPSSRSSSSGRRSPACSRRWCCSSPSLTSVSSVRKFVPDAWMGPAL